MKSYYNPILAVLLIELLETGIITLRIMNVYFAQIPITVWQPWNVIKWVLCKIIKEVLQGLWLNCAVSSFTSHWTIKRAIPKIRRERKIDTVSILSHSSLMRTDCCGTIPVSQQRLFHPAKVKWFEHFIFCDINNSNTGWQGPSYQNSWQTNHFHTKKLWKCERKKMGKKKEVKSLSFEQWVWSSCP